MHQKIPPDGFFDKSLRLANQGVQVMGTVKGLYDSYQFLAGGVRAAAPLLAML